jgi:sec-independent protein translocase protein TatC
MAESDDTKRTPTGMGFLEHLEELRWRLLKSVLTVVVFSIAAFYFSDRIITFIKLPLGDVQLYNIQVTGSFYAYLKVSLITGVLASLPIVFYQMWSFISPGLYKKEKILILPLVLTSTALFLIGAGFCFVVVLPLSFKFLIGFSGELIVNTITIGSYISFVGLLLIAFGTAFQLPVVAYVLGKIGLGTAVRPDNDSNQRRHYHATRCFHAGSSGRPAVFSVRNLDCGRQTHRQKIVAVMMTVPRAHFLLPFGNSRHLPVLKRGRSATKSPVGLGWFCAWAMP